MTISEALEYINNYTGSPRKRGLSRTHELLKRVGDPHKGLSFVHVAGTNGKGSTCAMTERILRNAGYRTGLFVSPHLEDFRERIQVNGEYISEEDLARITTLVAAEADKMEERLSQFELITVIGMVYFKEQNCDIVVLEVGMGGKFDSTNAIDAPLAAVIANIGFDHTDYLGNTLEEIATAKCGIIKEGCAVVSYNNAPSVMSVIESTASGKHCRLYKASDEEYPEGLGLKGVFQRENARTVLAVIRALRDKGLIISDEAVSKGLSEVTWNGRFEILGSDPVFILDGGHNSQCAAAVASSLKELMPGQKLTFLIGILADKDVENTLRILMPLAGAFVCVKPDSYRALEAEHLAEMIKKVRSEKGSDLEDPEFIIKTKDSISEGIEEAINMGEPVIAFGSLYMAGDIRKAYLSMSKADRKN